MIDPGGEGVLVQVGHKIGGRYRVQRALGAGSMGAVYEVLDPEERRFAVKVLLHDVQSLGGTQSVSRFLREAQISRDISEEHVAPALDGGIDEVLGLPFLVMELLNGEDLDACLARVKVLHPTTAIRIAIQASLGLAAAHERGIVHRDVKPANLLLHQGQGSNIIVKVCDFGVAKAFSVDETLTQSGSILGTPLFMAPEQVLNSKRVDYRADIWSLGATLFQALCGVSPFEQARSLAELLKALTSQAPANLQDLAPWIEGALSAIVHGTLIAEVDRRCPSLRDLIDALTPFSGGSLELDRSMLQPIPDEVRAILATRSSAPHLWATQAAPPSGPAAAEPPKDPLLGKRLADKYVVEAVIGRGGMGRVYRASTAEGLPCAIKVIQQEGSPPSDAEVRRFLREARTAKAIDSPQVVSVLDADTDSDRLLPFIVMELLCGTDLEKHVRRVGPLEPTVAVRVFLQAGLGLRAAHRLGIIHRDIKPANIFLHQADQGEVIVKICDFGVAKRTETGDLERAATELTRTGGMLGSPVYMSPEQAQNAKTVDARTDLWSLSLAMHEALSGKKPWEDCETLGQLILAICTRDLVRLQEIAPWVPREIAEVVERGLRRDLPERLASIDEFISLLEPLSQGSVRVTREDLVAVSRARRTIALGPAAVAVQSANAVTGAPLTTSTATGRVPRRRKGAVIAGAIALAGVGGAAILLATRAGPRSNQAPAAIPASSPILESSTSQRVVLSIQPPHAKVTVNGEERSVIDGGLYLQGVPGDRFKVVAEHQGISRAVDVFVGRDGRPSPDSVEIAESPHPSAQSSAGKPGRVVEAKRSETATKTSPETPKPSSTPAAPPGGKKLKPREGYED